MYVNIYLRSEHYDEMERACLPASWRAGIDTPACCASMAGRDAAGQGELGNQTCGFSQIMAPSRPARSPNRANPPIRAGQYWPVARLAAGRRIPPTAASSLIRENPCWPAAQQASAESAKIRVLSKALKPTLTYKLLISLTSLLNVALASPNNMRVFSWKNSGF